MKCDLCDKEFDETIDMQTVAAKMACRLCLAEAVNTYIQIKKGIYRLPPSKMDMGY